MPFSWFQRSNRKAKKITARQPSRRKWPLHLEVLPLEDRVVPSVAFLTDDTTGHVAISLSGAGTYSIQSSDGTAAGKIQVSDGTTTYESTLNTAGSVTQLTISGTGSADQTIDVSEVKPTIFNSGAAVALNGTGTSAETLVGPDVNNLVWNGAGTVSGSNFFSSFTFGSFAVLQGNLSDNQTFQGQNAANTWTLGDGTSDFIQYQSGSTAYTLQQFSNLEGGTQSDNFHLQGDASGLINLGFPLNIEGGSGTEIYAYFGSAYLNGNIVGGSGSNSLDYTGYSSPVNVELTGADTNGGLDGFEAGTLSGTFSNINTLQGTPFLDVLYGENVNSTWNVNDTSTYNDGTGSLTFSGFDVLQGGTADDTFNVTPLTTQPIEVVGGGSATSSGDVLNVNLAGVTSPNLTLTGTESGEWTFGNRQSLTYAQIEYVNSTNGTYALVLDMSNFQTGQHDYIDTQLDTAQTNFQVRVDTTLPASNLVFNGGFNSIHSFSVLGSTDTETLLVDGVHGQPIPSGGISFTAGGQTQGSDDLRILGSGSSSTAVYTPDGSTFGNGSVSETTASVVGMVTFTGIQSAPVEVSNMNQLTLQTPNPGSNLTLAQGLGFGNNVTATIAAGEVSGSSGAANLLPLALFDDTTFVLDTSTLGGSGADTVKVNGDLSNQARNLQNLTVSSGAGADTLTVNATVYSLPVAGGQFLFDGGSGSDEIVANGDIGYTLSETAGVGTLTSSAGGSITLNNLSGETAYLNSTPNAHLFKLQNWTGTTFLNNQNAGDTLDLTMTGGTVNIVQSQPLLLVNTVTSNASTNQATVNGNLNLNGANRTFAVADGAATNDLVINGSISGTSGLVKAGAGQMQFAGTTANTYSGSSTVQLGTLLLNKTPGIDAIPHGLVISTDSGTAADAVVRLAANNQIDDTSDVTVTSSGLFDLAGFNDTIHALSLNSGTTSGAQVTTGTGTLALGGNVNLNVFGTGAVGGLISGKLNLANPPHTFTIADGTATKDLDVTAVISDAGSTTVTALAKAGPGTLALDGANTYSGQTSVTGGTLSVGGTLNSNAVAAAGVVNLNSAGVVLTGSGTINGQVVVNASSAASHTQVSSVTIRVPTTSAGVGIDVVSGATFVEIGNGTAPVTIDRVAGSSNTSSIGVRVQAGASARLVGASASQMNQINHQHIGVLVDGNTTAGSGKALLQYTNLDNNTTSGSSDAGLQVQNGGIVDAGQLPGSYTPLPNGPAGNSGYYGDITGLAGGGSNHSSGGNSFAGYSVWTSSSLPTVPQAILDLNTGTAPFTASGVEQSNNYSAAGPQLGRMDIPAQNNTWGSATTLGAIEQVIYHDLDNTALGFVTYGTPNANPAHIVSTVTYDALYENPATAADGMGTLVNGNNLQSTTNANGTNQKSVIRNIAVTFDSFVFLDPNLVSSTSNRGLNLVKLNGPYGAPANTLITAGLSSSTSYNQTTGQYTVVWTFSGPGTEFGSLEDGNYQLQFNASAIQSGGPGGASLSGAAPATVDPATYKAQFLRYFGDSNGDGIVNDAELASFRSADRSQPGTSNYRAYYDFNADSAVDSVDYYQFERRYRSQLNTTTGAVSAITQQVQNLSNSLNSITLSNGTLTISGSPQGIMTVTQTAAGSFVVKDNNGATQKGATYTGVVNLTLSLAAHPDAIYINLGGFALPGNLSIDLGSRGDSAGHPLYIYNGTVKGSASIVNGFGGETLNLGLPGLVNTTPMPVTIRSGLTVTPKVSTGGNMGVGDALFIGPGSTVLGNVTTTQLDNLDIGEPNLPVTTVTGSVTVSANTYSGNTLVTSSLTSLVTHIFGNVNGNVKVTGGLYEDTFDLEQASPGVGGSINGTLTVDLQAGGSLGNVINLGAGSYVSDVTSLTSAANTSTTSANRFLIAGTLNKTLTVNMGSGTNALVFTGVVYGNMTVTGGSGVNDLGGGGLGGVFSGTVYSSLYITLGNGPNYFTFNGTVNGPALSYQGGNDIDVVQINNSSPAVLTVNLGGGNGGDSLIFAPTVTFTTGSTIDFGNHPANGDVFVPPTNRSWYTLSNWGGSANGGNG